MNPTPNPKQKRAPPRRSWLGRLALQSLFGLLATLCIGATAVVLRLHDDAARQGTTQREPVLDLIGSPAAAGSVLAQSRTLDVQSSTTKAASPQLALPSPAAETPP